MFALRHLVEAHKYLTCSASWSGAAALSWQDVWCEDEVHLFLLDLTCGSPRFTSGDSTICIAPSWSPKQLGSQCQHGAAAQLSCQHLTPPSPCTQHPASYCHHQHDLQSMCHHDASPLRSTLARQRCQNKTGHPEDSDTLAQVLTFVSLIVGCCLALLLQVQAKSKQLIEVLRGCSGPQHQALAYITLASRVVSQCEGQVQKINSFAFPLAYVCVAVGAAVPQFMELLLAKLQQVRSLPLTIMSLSSFKCSWMYSWM